ncbi:hypothetical protein [Roseovarius atlanticus]|uniref:hypothetical protein n=1 Tax=Roseovarius atlanticus TaxID=1641875 RepID=UPI001C96F921|nr:hypothetical protein [Roseovarius atlanticus]MBY5988186.1 hypothetical protein [Roseovarius atlanticus]MBY6123577.1 hypothetical protein [Roseovarius atlanticus]MBY6148072.1 hypothetical protein [Roseovarius atlanticus]
MSVSSILILACIIAIVAVFAGLYLLLLAEIHNPDEEPEDEFGLSMKRWGDCQERMGE